MTRSVLVLAGGGSRRLGRDKRWVDVGGMPVLSRVIVAARGALPKEDPDIMLSVQDPGSTRDVLDALGVATDLYDGVRVIEDDLPDAGPVAGLATGLRSARGEAVVVLAGDMPFISSRLIDGLFSELAGARGVDAVIPTVGGREQVLCAAYRRDVARRAGQLMDDYRETAGPETPGPSVRALAGLLDVRLVDSVAGCGAEELAVQCRGIDTPADLEWAREIASCS